MLTCCNVLHIVLHMQFLIVQVPSCNGKNAAKSLESFLKDFPALAIRGTHHAIPHHTPYVVDEEVQLVCKYLKGYEIGGTKGIDRLYKEGV